MTDPVSPDPIRPPPPAHSGAAAIVLIGAGVGLMVVGQTMLHMPAMAYVGLAVLAVGLVFGVISQRGT
ncbi:MAG: hypothetical protein Q7T19_02005 [Caulobacter sp.]|nr:hypothetical protein [Caulobacter sp.]